MLSELVIMLPLTDPILKFFIILLLICLSTILTERYRLPNLLILIIAGAVIGPHGFNLIERNDGIILSGTAGMLYILFLAGLEINSQELRRSGFKSLVFGLYTFLIPMILGLIAGRVIFDFSWDSSILLASMFASHTLIAYPIIRKYGVEKNMAVRITVGGTIFTDTLALLILAVIVRKIDGDVSAAFWLEMGVFMIIYLAFCLTVIPMMCRWFFAKFHEPDAQYVFILAMVFLGALLSEMIGLEGIIGAFVVGLALNRLVAGNSKLMYRIDFMGNSLFIPFFLIGIGMLIDFRTLFDLQSLFVGIVMILAATLSKFGAAWLAQKSFGFSRAQRQVIFGLSNAQAAATLAAVTVGYNIITGTTPSGEPIRLLNEYVLNGTILMIITTCTMATIYAQRGARTLAEEAGQDHRAPILHTGEPRLMIDMSEPSIHESALAVTEVFFAPGQYKKVLCLTPIKITKETPDINRYDKHLHRFRALARESDYELQLVRRIAPSYQVAVVNGCREYEVTDLILSKSVFGEKINMDMITSLQRVTNVFGLRKEGLTMDGRNIVAYIPESERIAAGSFGSLISSLISRTRHSASQWHVMVGSGESRRLGALKGNVIIREIDNIHQLPASLEALPQQTALIVLYHHEISGATITELESFVEGNSVFFMKIPMIAYFPKGDRHKSKERSHGVVKSDYL